MAAALALLIWPDFIVLSVTASGDMLFLALMLTSLAIASTPSPAIVRHGVLSGIVAGLASLTRTNGIVLLLLPLFFAIHFSRELRIRAALLASCGFFIPWSLWALFVAITSSGLFPSKTYIDIAVTFFGPDGHRFSSNSDNWAYAEATFSSLGDVLTHDPVALIRGVVRNSMTHGWSLFRDVSPALPAIGALAAGSLLYLLLTRRDPALWVTVLDTCRAVRRSLLAIVRKPLFPFLDTCRRCGGLCST